MLPSCRLTHRYLTLCSLLLTLTWLLCSDVRAYDPPVVKVGDVTVRIVGPDSITETKTLQYQVVVENAGSKPVAGRVKLTGIDGWTTQPAEGAPFQAAPQKSSTVNFQVTVPSDTYSAHYPLHAWASFQADGREQQAHPILVVETKLPAKPIEQTTLPWKPLTLGRDRSLALLDVPVFRFGVQAFGKQAVMQPVGWTGTYEKNRTSVRTTDSVTLENDRRKVIGIHPPWWGGEKGTAWLEYALTLPQQSPILAKFATAVTPSGNGDGVTFRVRAVDFDAPEGTLGEVVFERHSAAKTWEENEADLSRFAGKSIRLQFESHPGPKENTTFDQSYWAEPLLVIGNVSSPPPFPPTGTADSTVLGKVQLGGKQIDVHLWPGRQGLLDARIGFRLGQEMVVFDGFNVRVMGMEIGSGAAPVTLTDTKSTAKPGEQVTRHRFNSLYGTFDVVIGLKVADNALRASFRLENAPAAKPWFAPRLEEISLGRFSQPVHRVYAGHGNVLEQPEAFTLGFDGHRLATSHIGVDFADGISLVQAVDITPQRLEFNPTAGHVSLHAADQTTFTLIPADNVWTAVKQYREINGLKAAGGVKSLAGRFVFDIWGGPKFGDAADLLQQAIRYGLTDSAVVWHSWQRWGYDYRLPEIYPPNPQRGTEADLQRMIQLCKDADVLFALHDNYIDFYPDAKGFSYPKEIAFQENGQPRKAWLNEGREARSYRYRADRIGEHLRPNLQEIKKNLGPTAYFIDVWSSAPPYDYWTSDGKFFSALSTRGEWGADFAWIRELLGNNAPQISESGHDQLIGWLDGAQTNHLRVGPPVGTGRHAHTLWNFRCKDAERIPWFDVAHHDRFILHGAGYSTRYPAGLDPRMHGVYSDDYIATEVLTGHPTMAISAFGHDVVRKYWLTSDLMRALALRTIESVDFVGDDLHRQHVSWSNGGEIFVNRGKSDWQPSGETAELPEYGFLAKVPTAEGVVAARVSRQQGLIVEAAMSPNQVYVNARGVSGKMYNIRPTAKAAALSKPRSVKTLIEWDLKERIPEGARPFVHFVDAEGEIIFQGSYSSSQFFAKETGKVPMETSSTLPASIKPGDTLELCVGVYYPSNGGRIPLIGLTDSETRARLGTMQFLGQGEQITGMRFTPADPASDPYYARQNNGLVEVDFGPVETMGGCRIVKVENGVLLIPLPGCRTRPTRFTLNWNRLPWKLPAPTQIEEIDDDGQTLNKQKPTSVGKPTIETSANVFAYRFSAQ